MPTSYDPWDQLKESFLQESPGRPTQPTPEPSEAMTPPPAEPQGGLLNTLLTPFTYPGRKINELTGMGMQPFTGSSAPYSEQMSEYAAPVEDHQVSGLDEALNLATRAVPALAPYTASRMMLKNLGAVSPKAQEYGAAVMKPASELAAQMQTDPLSYAGLHMLPFLSKAPTLQKLLSLAFTAEMGSATWEAGKKATSILQEQGLTPGAVSAATQTLLSAGLTALGAKGLGAEPHKPGTSEALAGAEATEGAKMTPPPGGPVVRTEGGVLPIPEAGGLLLPPEGLEVAPRAKLALEHMANRAAGVAEQVLAQGAEDLPRFPGEQYQPKGAQVVFLDEVPPGAPQEARAFINPQDPVPTVYITPTGRAAILQAPDAAGVQARINEIVAHELTHPTADAINRGPGAAPEEAGHATGEFMDDRLKSNELLMRGAALEQALNQHPLLQEGAGEVQAAGHLEGAFQPASAVPATAGSFPARDLALTRGLQQEYGLAQPREFNAAEPQAGGMELPELPEAPVAAAGAKPIGRRMIDALLGKKQEVEAALAGVWKNPSRIAPIMETDRLRQMAPPPPPSILGLREPPKVSAALRNVEQKVPTPEELRQQRQQEGRAELDKVVKGGLPYHTGVDYSKIIDYLHENLVTHPGNMALTQEAVATPGSKGFGLTPEAFRQIFTRLRSQMQKSAAARAEGKFGKFTIEQETEIHKKLAAIRAKAPRLTGTSPSDVAAAEGTATPRQLSRLERAQAKSEPLFNVAEKREARVAEALTKKKDYLERLREARRSTATPSATVVDRLKNFQALGAEIAQLVREGMLPSGEKAQLLNEVDATAAAFEREGRSLKERAGEAKELQMEAPPKAPAKEENVADILKRLKASKLPEFKAAGRKPLSAKEIEKLQKLSLKKVPEFLPRERQRTAEAGAEATRRLALRTDPEARAAQQREVAEQAAANRGRMEVGEHGPQDEMHKLVQEAELQAQRATSAPAPAPPTGHTSTKVAEKVIREQASARIRPLGKLATKKELARAAKRPVEGPKEARAKANVVARGPSPKDATLYRTELKEESAPRPEGTPPNKRFPTIRKILVQGKEITPGAQPERLKVAGRMKPMERGAKKLFERVYAKNPHEVARGLESQEREGIENLRSQLAAVGRGELKARINEHNIKVWLKKAGPDATASIVRGWRDVLRRVTEPNEQRAEFEDFLQERLAEKPAARGGFLQKLGERRPAPLAKDFLRSLQERGERTDISQPREEAWPPRREKKIAYQDWQTPEGPVRDVLGSVEDVRVAAEQLLGKKLPKPTLDRLANEKRIRPVMGNRFSTVEVVSDYLKDIRERAEAKLAEERKVNPRPAMVRRLEKLIQATKDADPRATLYSVGVSPEKPVFGTGVGRSLEKLSLGEMVRRTGRKGQKPFDESQMEAQETEAGVERGGTTKKAAAAAEKTEQPEAAPLGGGFTIRAPGIRTSKLTRAAGQPSGVVGESALGQPVSTQPVLTERGAGRTLTAKELSRQEAAKRNFAMQFASDALERLNIFHEQLGEAAGRIHLKQPTDKAYEYTDILDELAEGRALDPDTEYFLDTKRLNGMKKELYQKGLKEFEQQADVTQYEKPSGLEPKKLKMQELPEAARAWAKEQDFRMSLSDAAEKAAALAPELRDDALDTFRRMKTAAEHRAGRRVTPAERGKLRRPPTEDLKEWVEEGGRIPPGDLPAPKDLPFAGGRPMTSAEFAKLQQIAAQHGGIKTFTKPTTATQQRVQGLVDDMFEWLNVGRPFKTALDVSNPLRQTASATFDQLTQDLISTLKGKPGEAKLPVNLYDMLRAYGNKDIHAMLDADLKARPTYEAAKKHGVRFIEIGNPNQNMIGAGKLEKMLRGVRLGAAFDKLIKPADRAFSYYQNKAMLDMYEYGLDWMHSKYGQDIGGQVTLEDLVQHVNNATSRGKVTGAKHVDKVIGQVLYSGQMTASRLRMLGHIASGFSLYKSPQARSYARMQTVRALAGFGTALGLAYAGYKAAGDDVSVETDLRSTDFMKLKVGNTTVDLGGGFQQYIVRAAQIESKQKKEITTGRLKDISPLDVITTFGRGKLGPGPSAAVDILQGRTLGGQAIDFKKDPKGATKQTLLTMLSNMNMQDMADVWKNNPHTVGLLPLAALMLMGAGTTSGSAGKEDWMTGEIRPMDIASTKELKKFNMAGPRPGHRITLPGRDPYGRRNYYNMTPGEVKAFEQEVMPQITRQLYDFVNSPTYQGLPTSKKPPALQRMIHSLNLHYSANRQKRTEFTEKYKMGKLKPSGFRPAEDILAPNEEPEGGPGGRGEKY